MSVERYARSDEQCSLNSVERPALVGHAGAISDVPNLPPPIPALVSDGTLLLISEALAEDLRKHAEFDRSECFIDGKFIVAKKGGGELEGQREAKV
jgi:hypothetical protein